MISTSSDIGEFIATQTAMVEILRTVEELCLPDCWVGAGFVRNPIWDALYDFPWSASYTDVDVVYFDAAEIDPERDSQIEARLAISIPGAPWSVKNQARMHFQNGDPPYADAAEAVRHWPETCTAIAARTLDARIELLAPFGVDNLISLVVQPTPAFANKIEIERGSLARRGKCVGRSYGRIDYSTEPGADRLLSPRMVIRQRW